MIMNKRWIVLILLILGMMIASGCATISQESMTAYNEAKSAFQKATLANAKNCAPCQYATAEAYVALADNEVADKDDRENLKTAIRVVKEKSLEAVKICQTPPAPPPPPPPPPTPPPPPPPPVAPPPPPPKPVAPPAPPKPVAPPVFDTIYFDPNKTNISPTAAKALDRDGMILKENPQIKVEIGGHTDAGGSEKVNQKISEKRALSAKKYLQDKFNIPDNRMIIKGYGATKPIADNQTQEGRSKNRRVEFRVIP